MLLSQYLPPYLMNTKTFKALVNSQQIEITKIENSALDIIDQCFVETATWGLVFWESFVKIKTDTNKTYENRRANIKAKLIGSGNVTKELIKAIVSGYLDGTISVEENSTICSFNIGVSGNGTLINLIDLQNTIEQIKPAHLEVTYTFDYIGSIIEGIYAGMILSSREKTSINPKEVFTPNTWDELDGYSFTWDEWDALGLNHDQKSFYNAQFEPFVAHLVSSFAGIDGYNYTWNQWDALSLTWTQKELL